MASGLMYFLIYQEKIRQSTTWRMGLNRLIVLDCIASSCENLGLVDDLVVSVLWALGLTGSVTSSCQSTYNAKGQLLNSICLGEWMG